MIFGDFDSTHDKCNKNVTFSRGSNIAMTLKNCGELSTVPQFIYCFFAYSCNKDSWYVGHNTWLACQRSRVRFREETFFLARKNLRNLRTLTSESILEILAPMPQNGKSSNRRFLTSKTFNAFKKTCWSSNLIKTVASRNKSAEI